MVLPRRPPKSAAEVLLRLTEACQHVSYIGVAADREGLRPAMGMRLCGFAVRESAAVGAAATFILRHGVSSAAPLLIPVELLANESAREYWWPGINADAGVWIDWIAGEFDIALFYNVR